MRSRGEAMDGNGEARKEARRVDEICRAAAVMMRGRGVPLDVVASVLHVSLLRVKKWTERRLVV